MSIPGSGIAAVVVAARRGHGGPSVDRGLQRGRRFDDGLVDGLAAGHGEVAGSSTKVSLIHGGGAGVVVWGEGRVRFRERAPSITTGGALCDSVARRPRLDLQLVHLTAGLGWSVQGHVDFIHSGRRRQWALPVPRLEASVLVLALVPPISEGWAMTSRAKPMTKLALGTV